MDPEIAVQVDAVLSRLQRAVAILPALSPPPAERRYQGPLTGEQQASGVRNALANARDLLGDARTLLERGRAPTAAALAVLSHEECWKAALTGFPPGPLDGSHPESLRDFWGRYYRHHQGKSGTPGYISLLGVAFTLEQLRVMDNLLGPAADHLKLLGFYSDYRRDAGQVRATLPAHEVSRELAEATIELADSSLAVVGAMEDQLVAVAQGGLEAMVDEDTPAMFAQIAAHYPGLSSIFDIVIQMAAQGQEQEPGCESTGSDDKGVADQ